MIGLVLVSHSAALAGGVAELSAQMGEGVTIAAAGGTDDGEIGTSLELVMAAIAEADSGDGAIVLYDLGSAQMTAEMALEMLDDEQRSRVLLVDAPLVEGAISAATEAAGGADLGTVRAAAEAAGGGPRQAAGAAEPGAPAVAGEEQQFTLPNPLGLHARPAAMVVRALRGLDAEVTIRRTDSGASTSGRSILGLVGLAAGGGIEVAVSAGGPDAPEALAAVTGLIEDGFGEMEEPAAAGAVQPSAPAGTSREPGRPAATAGALVGQPGAPGIAVGPLTRLHLQPVAVPDEPVGDAAQERARLAEARREVAAGLEQRGRRGDGAAPEADIFAAHAELLADPELDALVEDGLAAGRSAAAAWADAIEEQRQRVAALPGEVFAQRAADVADVGRQVLAALLGVQQRPDVGIGSIVFADDVVPSLVPALRDAGAAGLALAGGSATSHVAVLARGLGLPLVVGLGDALQGLAEETPALLDGDQGLLRPDPPAEVVRSAQETQEQERLAHEQARAGAAARAVTPDGTAITVAANVASVAEARAAVEEGADEVGLLRTELAYLDRQGLPGEDEQVEVLSAILDVLHPRPVVVRTLDVGGDKPAPALGLDPVRNGFLGQRGLRLSLARPDLFRTQLRAILRAASGHHVRLMFPLVTTVEEVRAAKQQLSDARASLEADGQPFGDVEQVGIMVEVPAAALAADYLAPEVDFFSIGSNDLLQYVMAADRTLSEVAALRDPHHAALLRLVAMTCDAARAAGCWVGVCGETAGDPDLARLLIGLGVTELSMAPRSIPAVKALVRETPKADAEAAARAAIAGLEGAFEPPAPSLPSSSGRPAGSRVEHKADGA